MAGRCCSLLRVGLIIAAAAGSLLLADAAKGGTTISGDALAHRLASPHALFLDRATVIGPLNLQQIDVVRAAFECRFCTFTGGIRARHVVFEREIDLGGAEVHGPLDFGSASFAGPLILGSALRPTRVNGRADFRLATFADVTVAERVLFQQGADFGLSRFRGDAVFTDAEFRRAARFTGVSFDGRARFDGGSFTRDTDFADVVFGATADFRRRVFNRGSHFGAVDFRGLADFAQATFRGVAEFDDARFEKDATFRGATFEAVADAGDDRALSMGFVVAQEKLDFGSATFNKFVLAENVVARALSFDDVTFQGPAQITLAKLRVQDFQYPLEDVGRIADPAQQRDVLGQIESSAKNRGDIGLANDAHYRLQKLAAHDYGTFWQVADTVFYRGIAGYFVRPRRPLAVLVVLVFALSLVRWFSRADSRTAATLSRGRMSLARFDASWRRSGTARGLGDARRWLNGLVIEIFDTFGLAMPRLRGGSDQTTKARGIGRRLEILAYRLLVVCVLLGLANSNPTLRQMFDALV